MKIKESEFVCPDDNAGLPADPPIPPGGQDNDKGKK